MSYDNYEGLIEEIEDILARGDLQPKIPDWITIVERHLVTVLRDLRENQLETTGNFVAGQDWIDMPAGATNIRQIRIDTDPLRHMNVVSPAKFIDVTEGGSAAGLNWPTAFMVHGESGKKTRIKLAPAPLTTDGYTVFYAGALAKVDEAKTTSQILREAPYLLVAGACEKAMDFTQNAAEKQKWAAEYQKQEMDYRQFLSRMKVSGGALRVRPDSVPGDAHTTWDVRR